MLLEYQHFFVLFPLPEEHEVQEAVAVFFVPLAVRFVGPAAVVRRVHPHAVLHVYDKKITEIGNWKLN
jgi:hypothetical protein